MKCTYITMSHILSFHFNDTTQRNWKLQVSKQYKLSWRSQASPNMTWLSLFHFKVVWLHVESCPFSSSATIPIYTPHLTNLCFVLFCHLKHLIMIITLLLFFNSGFCFGRKQYFVFLVFELFVEELLIPKSTFFFIQNRFLLYKWALRYVYRPKMGSNLGSLGLGLNLCWTQTKLLSPFLNQTWHGEIKT